MIPTEWIAHFAPWLDASGDRSDLVLSSRVRLARDLRGCPFPHRANRGEQSEAFDIVSQAACATPELHDATAWDLEELSEWERRLLVERHLASRRLLNGTGRRGIVAATDESLSVAINEEDHVRIQAVTSGLDLDHALSQAAALDRALEASLSFAVSPEYGYLTACPTNVGTGLRASVLVHLAGLVLSNEVKRVHQAVGEMGVVVRGWFGEGSRALGDYYQISNQRTLGRPEAETVEELERVVLRVIELELEARERILDDGARRRRVEDRIHRSRALLGSARLLTVDQAMACASDVRLGKWMGRFDETSNATLNHFGLAIQPAHLGREKGEVPDAEEAEWLRARVARKAFSSG